MKFFIVALACVCIAQGAFARAAARPRAEAPKKDVDTAAFDDLVKNIGSTFEDLSKKFADAVGIKSSDDFIKQLKEGTNKLAGDMNAGLTQLSEAAKKYEPEVQQQLKGFQESLKGIADKIKTENPEATATAQKIHENVQQNVNKLIDEVKKMQKQFGDNTSGAKADVEKFATQAIDKILEAGKDMRQKLAEHTKKN